MPSRRGFFHHINQAQSPNSNNQSGRAEWRLYSVNGVNCWDWHWIRPPVILLLVAHGRPPLYGTGQRTNRRGIDL